MRYSDFVDVYEQLAGTTKKLEKTAILAEFLKKLRKDGNAGGIYLLRGKVAADYDSREFGISTQLVIKAISSSFGIKNEEVVKQFNKVGDLGNVSEFYADKRKQSVLFSKRLDAAMVFDTLRKLLDI